KEYIAKIRLGFHSTTDDEEGEKTEIVIESIPDSELVNHVVNSFKGEGQQTPPIYSAIKLRGVPAYKRARKRENFEMEARTIIIHDIIVLEYEYPILEIKVTTGPGVYIR